ncbi:hypothetical protein MFLAVUS_004122 [Mucor flavus]|uniref:Uncharacterized protein n=1 Tax=Mucor flavus TaxID=439312 RepID=A0ABP9YV14_9FUNG
MSLSSSLLSRIPCWLQAEQWWSLWQLSFVNSRTLEFQQSRLDNLRQRLWFHQQKTIESNIIPNKFYLDTEENLISDNEEEDDDDDDSSDLMQDLTFEKKQVTFQSISLLTQMLEQKPNMALKRSQAKLSLDAWFSSTAK